MTPDLATLIERLEKASGPDRGLDRQIRDALDLPSMLVPPDGGDEAHPYTASIDAALTLVPENHWWTLDGEDVDGAGEVERPGALVAHYMVRDVRMRVSAATPAIALCIASLRARLELSKGGVRS